MLAGLTFAIAGPAGGVVAQEVRKSATETIPSECNASRSSAPVVKHIYFDNAGVACTTDAVGEKIVRPGVRVKCERLPTAKEARK